MIIYFDFIVDTGKLGELKFSTITYEGLEKSEKFAMGKEDDRTAIVQILHRYLINENVSIEDISSINDNELESIARQLLEKSQLIDKLDETEVTDSNFFFSFRNAYKKIIVGEMRSRANQEKLLEGGLVKIKEEASRHFKTYSFIEDIKNLKNLFDTYQDQRYLATDKIAIELKNQEQNFMHSFQSLSSKVQELERVLRPPSYDFASMQPQLPALSAISSANIAIADILGQQRMEIENLALGNVREIAMIEKYSKNQLDSEFSLLSQYTSIGDISSATEKIISEIIWKDMGSSQNIPFQEVKSVETSFARLTDRYSELYHSLENSKFEISSLKSFVIELPPLELFAEANLIRSISRPTQIEPEKDFLLNRNIKEGIEGTLEELLCDMDPGLVQIWHGAKKALKSTNPDRYRHVVISLRELVTHVLHITTPDKEVLNWISDPTHLYNGRPTRKARFFYLCRKINHGPFAPFLQSDVDAHLSFIDLFQRGTHELNISFTEKQMELLIVRAETLLRFLLIISRNN